MIVTPFAQVSSRVGHENEKLAQSDINRQLETLRHVVSDDHSFKEHGSLTLHPLYIKDRLIS